MNNEFCSIYEGTFSSLTNYSKLQNTGTYDIQINAYQNMKMFEGLFNILKIFESHDISQINKINDLYNDLNGVVFDGSVIFKDLSDDDKKDAALHIIEAFKLIGANAEF